MDAAAARASIIVIDACRDNPLPAGSGRNLARGLSVVGMKPKNSIVIYAAEAGSKALDGLFTPILASSLKQKGRSINQIMMGVRSEVYAKSSGQQTPGEYNQLFEELFLGEIPRDKLVPEAIITATPSPNPNPAIFPEIERKETLAVLKKRAEQEHASDQDNLGNIYYNGKGAPKDMAEEVKRYVPKDIVEAYAIYTLLASVKDENTLKSRDLIAKEMTREQIAAAQKLT